MTPAELRSRRTALGLTQGQLAARIGVHWTTLSRWENDRLRMERPEMIDLALRGLEQEVAER